MRPTSEGPCKVSVVAPPAADTVWIRLVGTVEMGAEPALETAVDRVRNRAPRAVTVDLAGVTFASSALVNLLIRLHLAAPRASIHLVFATPAVQRVLAATGFDQLTVPGNSRWPEAR